MSISHRVILSLLVFWFLFILISCDLNPYSKGKKIYDTYCIACHMEDGTGLASLIPPLAKSDYYRINQDKLTCIILNGLADTIVVNGRTFGQKMEGVKLTPIQITNLTNYINTSWGNDIPIKTLSLVEEEVRNCLQ